MVCWKAALTAESLVEYLVYLLAVSKAEYSAAWLADLTAAHLELT
jgi:hypothetical protein